MKRKSVSHKMREILNNKFTFRIHDAQVLSICKKLLERGRLSAYITFLIKRDNLILNKSSAKAYQEELIREMRVLKMAKDEEIERVKIDYEGRLAHAQRKLDKVNEFIQNNIPEVEHEQSNESI